MHVDDHAEALLQVAQWGALGHSYNIGGNNEYSNVAVVRSICRLVDELAPSAAIGRRAQLMTFVSDRPGHDARYAMDATKISHDLGWTPRYSFETGLRQTVQWYLENRSWWERVRSRLYRGERLGIAVLLFQQFVIGMPYANRCSGFDRGSQDYYAKIVS